MYILKIWVFCEILEWMKTSSHTNILRFLLFKTLQFLNHGHEFCFFGLPFFRFFFKLGGLFLQFFNDFAKLPKNSGFRK